MTLATNYSKRYVSSVADYLAANRCAGRYIISVADTMAAVAAISVIGSFEAYYRAGFTFGWWGMLGGVLFLVALSGWVQYRFRETRVLTMPQLLEMRYGKNFRVFVGTMTFFTGITAAGILPAVAGRFFIHLFGFKSHMVTVLGLVEIDLTLAIVIAILLAITLYFTFVGGRIAIMLTDFLQGTITNVAFIAVMLFILMKLPWSEVYTTLLQRPPGESMIDPFDTANMKIFNVWYFVINTIAAIWLYQGFDNTARSAHEARMAKAMGVWRMGMQGAPILWVAVGAYIVMHSPAWAPLADKITILLDNISANPDDTIRKQVTSTVAMSQFLPVGLLGCFAAVILSFYVTTQDSYLLAWVGIFVQDVILPYKKKRLSPQQHLKLLRLATVGVVLWLFFFSLLFRQYDAIFMYLALMGILGVGLGSAIVFGLYWKRGTAAGAYATMITGIVGFVTCFTLQKLWLRIYNTPFPINSAWLMFIFMIISIIVYVLVSLLGKKQVFNMDKMLHRGKYAVATDKAVTDIKSLQGWQGILGMTSEFTRWDKIIYCFLGGWSIFWMIFFCLVCLYRAFFDIPAHVWSGYWLFSTWLTVCLSIATTIWFLFGGVSDLKKMFHALKTMKRDHTDDGEFVEQPDASDQEDSA